MSISNLFEPNAYDLFCDALTANTLNVTNETITNLTVTNLIATNSTVTTETVTNLIATNSRVTTETVTTDNVTTLNVSTIQSNPPGGNVNFQGIVFYSTNQIAFPIAPLNRKLSLGSTTLPTDTTEFYGFGTQANTLVYEVESTSANHIFYAATGPSTNIELLRVVGNNGGVIFPSVGAATAGQLNYYENNSLSYAFSGIWATTYNATIDITRIGNQVTLSVTSTFAAATGSGVITSTAIASRFFPVAAVAFAIPITDNATNSIGTLQLSTSGILQISTGSNSAFSGSSTLGNSGFLGFSVSYLVS